MKNQKVVAVEVVASLQKVRIEFADGKYAYFTQDEFGAALRQFAEDPDEDEPVCEGCGRAAAWSKDGVALEHCSACERELNRARRAIAADRR
jgi:hypothetical protein